MQGVQRDDGWCESSAKQQGSAWECLVMNQDGFRPL